MVLPSDFWIIRPLNTLFMLVFGAFIFLLIAASLLLRGKSERVRSAVLLSACFLTMIGFVVYKIFLSRDSSSCWNVCAKAIRVYTITPPPIRS